MIAYHDGEWLDERDVRLPVRDAAVLSGHGVFESIRLHEGRFFRVDAHLERLAASAAMLRIDVPPREDLVAILLELAQRSALAEASARVTLTAGAATGAPPSTIATISPIADDWHERAARGWRIVTADTRHPHPASVPPGLKSLGRVYSVLARQEARDAGVDDALMLLPDGTVAEGPTWNFFFRVDGVVHTASTDAVLGGVTRAAILDIAAGRGIAVEVGLPHADLLPRADAAFASMSSLGVVPVLELDGRTLPGSTALAGPLQEAYWSLVRNEGDRIT